MRDLAVVLGYGTPAMLLVIAGGAKLGDLPGFRSVIATLGGVWQRFARPLAVILSLLEAAIGVAVLAFPGRPMETAVGVMFLALGVIELRLRVIRIEGSCHCYGRLLDVPPSKVSAGVNGVCAVVALVLAVVSRWLPVPLGMEWGGSLIGGWAAGFVLILSLNVGRFRAVWPEAQQGQGGA